MRNIIVLTFLSLDGVMQAPGGPTEDTEGKFTLGGWAVPYFDEALGNIMDKQMNKPFDLLLGRKTFEIFASYWPDHNEDGASINKAVKYVASNTIKHHKWEKSVFLHDSVVEEISKLKQQNGPDLQVHGSANLIQTLLKHDLIDEFWLKIFPVTLGKGKKLFENSTLPLSFTLSESSITPKGVIVANYTRQGSVQTGTF